MHAMDNGTAYFARSVSYKLKMFIKWTTEGPSCGGCSSAAPPTPPAPPPSAAAATTTAAAASELAEFRSLRAVPRAELRGFVVAADVVSGSGNQTEKIRSVLRTLVPIVNKLLKETDTVFRFKERDLF
jgi:hypothetical protein